MRAFAAFLIVAGATAAALVAAATIHAPGPARRATAPARQPGPPIPRPTRAGALFARRPQLGVACRVPNSIRCDRVAFGVWLRRPADSVRAAIAGRRFALSYQASVTRVRMYVGFLRPAGLADGPLRVPFTAGGRWYGEGAPTARVRVWVESGNRIRTTVARIPLRAGWG